MSVDCRVVALLAMTKSRLPLIIRPAMNLNMGEQSRQLGNSRLWFWGLLTLAIALRIAAFDPYATHHADETIQYLEQAHRMVFGYGVVPWEFRYFIRSWLIPLMMVPPMALGEAIDPGGTLYLILPRAMVALINLSPVVAAWFIGARQSRQHAIVAMAVMAVWVECVYFSVHILSESLATSLFLAAAALLHDKAKFRAIVAAGFLMGLAGLMRFQFAPAIAIYAAMVAGRDRRLWKGLLAGGLPVVALGAGIDMAMGLTPYEWILTNYRMNIGEGRMREIGGVSTSHYLDAVVHFWGWAVPVIAVFVALAWRRHKALIVMAIVNIAVHQLIGHKEYRYLWLSMQTLLLVAALGSVNALHLTIGRRRLDNPDGLKPALWLIGGWAAASLLLATGSTYRVDWRQGGAPSRLAAAAMRDPAVCGLGVPRREYTLFGYALLHRRKPIFLIPEQGRVSLADPANMSTGFNAMLSWADLPQPKGFPVKTGCRGGPRDRICLYRRPGGCVVDPVNRPYLYQETLLRFDR